MQIENKIWFRNICIKNGLILSDLQLDQLEHYVNLLLDWNKKINLISRKDEENIWTYHILHCVSLLFKIKILKGCKIVDIGTGGGMPGIPLKIIRPDISLLCIDSTRKKISAVSQISNDLKLNDTEILWGRAEEIGVQPDYLHKFDFAVARAVAPISDLISWSNGFLKMRQQSVQLIFDNNLDQMDPIAPALIAYKGGDLLREIESAKQTHPQLDVNIINLVLNGSEHLIASDKKILVIHI